MTALFRYKSLISVVLCNALPKSLRFPIPIQGGDVSKNLSLDLIETKLHAATPAHNETNRAIVLSLCAADCRQSLAIVGAAGLGKSTLMRQIFAKLEATGTPCSWLSLDPRDDAPSAFVPYLFEAIRRLTAGSGPSLSEPSDLSTPTAIEGAFAILQRSIVKLPPKSVIFLDDLHCIQHPQLLSGLGYFLDACAGKVRIIFGSRTLPDLQIQRREIEGHFKRISEKELRFNSTETNTFFEAFPHFDLSGEDSAAIHSLTEGWAAGLQFAAVALQNDPTNKRSLIKGMSGAQADLARYLATNALEIQPPDVQAFLLCTAPLNSFDAELCQYICPHLNASRLLDEIRKSNLFLIGLDVSEQWFRYHHLFSEFLVAELDKSDANAATEIKRKARDWYIQRGEPESAIRYCLDTADYRVAADLIAEIGINASRDQGQLAAILRWIEALPLPYRSHHPQLIVAHSTALVFSRGGAEARLLLDTVHRGFASSPSKWDLPEDVKFELICYAEAVTLISYSADEDSTKALTQTAKWLEKWPDASDVNLAVVYIVKAHSLMVKNNFSNARHAVTQAQACALRSGSAHVSIWAECIDVMILSAEGKLSSAASTAKRLLKRAQSELGEQTQLKSMVGLTAAFVQYEQGDRASAYAGVTDGEEFANSYGPVEPLLITFRLRAQMLKEQGQISEGIAVLERGFEIGISTGLSRLAITMLAEKVTFLLEAGELQVAQDLCDKWGVLDPEGGQLLGPQNLSHTTLRKRVEIEMCLARKDAPRAAMLSQSLIRDLQTSGRFRTLIRISILRAVALSHGGQTKKSWRELSATLRRAKDAGFVASFFELRHLCEPIIRDIVSYRQEQPQYATEDFQTPEDWILDILASGPRASVKPLETGERAEEELAANLTKREKDMLRLAVLGQSNAEIATTLLISVSTVKWHMHNAFQKLHAKNRSAAIAKVRNLGFL